MDCLNAVGWWNPVVAKGKDRPVDWIWRTLIAEEAITLLSGAAKSGKSTLLAMLLDRRREGGLLLGEPVRPGLTVVVSEEPQSLWARRQQRFDFGPNVYFCHPLGDIPRPGRWRRFIDHLLEIHEEREFDLLVVDTLSSFLPAAENHALSLRKAFSELRLIASLPAGVLVLHHMRRAGGRAGHAARGSDALPALADILLDLHIPGGDPFTRRRRLAGIGRYPETPQRLLVEMNAEATDYAVLADADEDAAAFAGVFETLRYALAAGEREQGAEGAV